MRTIDWDDGRDWVVVVDRTELPAEYTTYHAETVEEVVESIRILRVRGAPALGAAGAFGVALAARTNDAESVEGLREELRADADRVANARPTAVNLSRAVEHARSAADDADSVAALRESTLRATKELADRDVEKPEPGPTEVLVRVRASSVNPVDTKIRQAGSWAGISPPTVIGYDVSGVVEAVGEEVTDFAEGDEVCYTPEIFGQQGSYAEYHVADVSIVAQKPANRSHEEAAALPLAGATAWETIVARGDVDAGVTVLVHGAGGVGAHAVQIAAASGAQVVATASPETVEQTEDLGAARAIEYAS